MPVFTTLTARLSAAATALTLSLILFANTLSVSQHDLVATSFVGALA
ncbi:MAG: hypothetical protein RLZZ136_780 [Pseudomonadota bacterium]|jgi:hypothetical protein